MLTLVFQGGREDLPRKAGQEEVRLLEVEEEKERGGFGLIAEHNSLDRRCVCAIQTKAQFCLSFLKEDEK